MISAYSFLFQKIPPYFIFWVTQNCNLTCDHCFNYLENKKENNDLNLEEIEQMLTYLPRLKYVNFAGGEPFLRKDFLEVVKLFSSKSRLEVANIVTNGWYTDRIASFVSELLNGPYKTHLSFVISLDGPESIHNQVRKNEQSFQKAMNTIEFLCQAMRQFPNKVTVVASATYNKINASSLENLAQQLAKQMKVPLFLGLIRGQEVQNNSLKEIDIDHYRELSHLLYESNKKVFNKAYPHTRIRLAINNVVTKMNYRSYKEKTHTLECYAGEKGFVLTSNGDVLFCEPLMNNLGNIRKNEMNIMKVLNSSEALALKKKIKLEKCHCTWECFNSMNAVFSHKGKVLVAKQLLEDLGLPF